MCQNPMSVVYYHHSILWVVYYHRVCVRSHAGRCRTQHVLYQNHSPFPSRPMLNHPPEPTCSFPLFEVNMQMSTLHVVSYGVHIRWYYGLFCSSNDNADEDDDDEDDDTATSGLIMLSSASSE